MGPKLNPMSQDTPCCAKLRPWQAPPDEPLPHAVFRKARVRIHEGAVENSLALCAGSPGCALSRLARETGMQGRQDLLVGAPRVIAETLERSFQDEILRGGVPALPMQVGAMGKGKAKLSETSRHEETSR